jgi:hypothetical protein
MIIFTQDPTQHSRLANSLVWMAKIQNFLQNSKMDYYFPWAIENFGAYLEESSTWLKNNSAPELFLNNFGQHLTAQNLSHFSRKIEHDFEVQNNLKAFQWIKISTYREDYNCLYLAGTHNLYSSEIYEKIKNSTLIIIKEPYNLIYPEFDFTVEDFKNIKPNLNLYNSQKRMVEEIGRNKKNIGFHIRRGDYKNWADGKYFYDDDYWLDRIQIEIKKNNCVWVFGNDFSNEFLNRIKSTGAIVSQASFESDFVSLMFMNVIYGPPSTFTNMASKIANVVFQHNCIYTQLPPKF